MTIWELPQDERIAMTRKIQTIIGKKDEWVNDRMTLSDKIAARARYDKTFEKIAKTFMKHGDDAAAMVFQDMGATKRGVTVSGKRWELYMNNGYATRSRTCGTLYIEGEGCIFTSGSLERVFEYVLTH